MKLLSHCNIDYIQQEIKEQIIKTKLVCSNFFLTSLNSILKLSYLLEIN